MKTTRNWHQSLNDRKSKRTEAFCRKQIHYVKYGGNGMPKESITIVKIVEFQGLDTCLLEEDASLPEDHSSCSNPQSCN